MLSVVSTHSVHCLVTDVAHADDALHFLTVSLLQWAPNAPGKSPTPGSFPSEGPGQSLAKQHLSGVLAKLLVGGYRRPDLAFGTNNQSDSLQTVT